MPGAEREDAMQISVTRDGRIYFRNNIIMLQDLPEQIRQGVQNGAEKRIYLNADARAKYADVLAVLDQIRVGWNRKRQLPHCKSISLELGPSRPTRPALSASATILA
jgi:hypothetical protein